MRGLLRAGLVVLCLVLVVCQSAWASWNVTEITIEPSDPLLQEGTPVTVVAGIDFFSENNETFSRWNELQLATDLEDQIWIWNLTIDGVEKLHPEERGHMLSLGGWDINYPGTVQESLKITLKGKTPIVKKTTNRTLFQIQEQECCSYKQRIAYTAIVINTTEPAQMIDAARVKLQAFRTHIDEKKTMGVNTTEAEVKYLDASAHISAASHAGMSDYEERIHHLRIAEEQITEGERLLDRAWAEQEIAMAQVPVQNTDNILSMIITNRTGPPALREIIRKREEAVSYIIIANDEFTAGNYSAARESAGIASALGNESYTSALDYVQQQSRPTPPAPLSAWCCIIALGSAGIIIYRKRLRG